MKPLSKIIVFLFVSFCLLHANPVLSQDCVTLGQTPSTAFPVCGTTTFHQLSVPTCATANLFVPGCSGSSAAAYQNKNPFFYQFTCFTTGSLGFVISPLIAAEDYDWQLYDITGHNPDDIFSDASLIVSGNWSGSYGNTGASAGGVNFIQCASIPTDNAPTFASMPLITQGHTYLLMVSHFTDTQSGYDLSFGGGTAVITDPLMPHLLSAKPDCDGKTITVKLNKKIRCNSLSGNGSEFIVSPGANLAISAVTSACSSSFDFDTVSITLTSVLTNGTYQLVMKNGDDGNTLLDDCGNSIPVGESISFQYTVPQPIFADSVGHIGCAPDSVLLYFPKRIQCATIAADGSDFSVTGPTPVTVSAAYGGNCSSGKSDYIVVQFATPIYTKGTYQLKLKVGTDGGTVTDECGIPTPIQTISFNTADTVSALFQDAVSLGCRKDVVMFSHNGANEVNTWNWQFNGLPVNTPTYTISFSANSIDTVQLIVSNGVCQDTVMKVLTFDNEVLASFTMASIMCPEDKLAVVNTSTGLIDSWNWIYDVVGNSNQKDPPPFQMPNINREAYYTIKLIASNATLGCSDTTRRTLTILDNCLIAVPSAFTPNNDGLNDYFWPHNALKADNYDFKVFNRWGQMVFHTRDWTQKWDGKINGIPQATGVFVWMLSYTNRDTQQPVFQKGTVTLIR